MPATAVPHSKTLAADRFRSFAPVLVLVALVVLVGALRPSFFNPESLLVTVADTATLFILAAGTTFVVILGSIDLSIQAICSLASVIVALLLPHYGYFGCLAALAAGLLAGITSGILHVWLRILHLSLRSPRAVWWSRRPSCSRRNGQSSSTSTGVSSSAASLIAASACPT
jgi:predicted ABC-type sugar transport system permease subunit